MKTEIGKGLIGWYPTVYKVILMAQGKRIHFMDDITDTRELQLMSARIRLYNASILSISDIDHTNLNDKLDEKFLTPEKRERLEKEKVRDVNELPEVYRKEKENEKYEWIPLSQIRNDFKSSTQSPGMKIAPRKKWFNLFKQK